MEESTHSDLKRKYVDIRSCARCGGDHDKVLFIEFAKPIRDNDGTIWAWWGTCPDTNAPIVLKIEDR